MPRMKKTPPIAIVLILLMIVMTSYSFMILFFQTTQPRHSSVSLASPDQVQAFEPTSSSSSWISPDGSVSLKIDLNYDSEDSKTYTVSVHPELKEQADQLIFSKTVSAEVSYQVPYNTWSPDNKYFFLKEVSGGDEQILVFKADGEPFRNGQSILNLTEFFAEKLPQFSLKEVTGWASPTLLIANAHGSDEQTDGPSFWFEVTSTSFIRLSGNFN